MADEHKNLKAEQNLYKALESKKQLDPQQNAAARKLLAQNRKKK